MHELSIAVNLVDIATREAAAAGSEQVDKVFLKVGVLSGVVRDALAFSFDIATQGTILEGATLDMEEVPVVVFCPTCQTEQTLPDVYPLRCPACGTMTADIRHGKELEIVALEVH